jgi:transposase
MKSEPAPTPDCPGCRQRDQRIAALEQRLADMQRQIDELRSQVEQSQQQGKRQAAPFRRQHHVENPKKPGQRKGHQRACRPIPAKIDRTIDVPCDTCPDCCQPLTDKVLHTQFQTDLPPVVPIVTRFNIHGGTCPCCHRYHQGRHPEMISNATGAANNQIGPVALTMAAELKHRLGVPYRKIADFFGTYFRLSIRPSTFVRAEQRLAAKAEPTFQLLLAALRSCGVVHADETGWRVGRLNAWLWVFTCAQGTIYAIRHSRGHEVPEEILGPEFDGILVVDGWSAYNVLDCRKGRCNGHILKRCRNLLEQEPSGNDAALLRALMAILREGLELSSRREELPEQQYKPMAVRWEEKYDEWLFDRALCGGEEVDKLRRHLLSHYEEFSRHVFAPGVPGTNNAAEQKIRPAVIVRKVGGCNKTLRGALVHAVLASVIVSVHQQGLRFLELALALWRQPQPEALTLAGTVPTAEETDEETEPDRCRPSRPDRPVFAILSG